MRLAGAGALIGLILAWLSPRTYLATGSLYFPEVQTPLFQKLTNALQAIPGQETTVQGSEDSSAYLALAFMVFRSSAARDSLQDRYLKSIEIRGDSDRGIHFSLYSNSAASARGGLQGLWDYYTDFIKEHPVSKSSQVRKSLEAALATQSTTLRKLEERLAASSDKRLQSLGDSAIKTNPKIMAQIWLKRTEEEVTGRAILDTLAELRGNQANKEGGLGDQVWLSKWAAKQKQLPGRHPKLRGTVRRKDLLERLQLERQYYDALLEFRSLLLQHSFLKTMEELENPNFEIVDPIKVTLASRWKNYALGLFSGCLLGALLSASGRKNVQT